MINQVLEFAFLERTYPFGFEQYAGHDVKNFFRLHRVIGVPFDSCQSPGILAQKLGGLCAFRIKITYPALPRPNGTTDIEVHILYLTSHF